MLVSAKPTVYCGDPLFESALQDRFEVEQLPELPPLLIDRPLGWAALPHAEINVSTCVVLTNNACPNYLLDVLELKPIAILPLVELAVLPQTIIAALEGENRFLTPITPLTKVERKTLRLTALGHSNKEIAKARNVTEHTVKNSLAEVYRKLGLSSRVQAAHYYLGHWHLLKSFKLPEDIKVF